VLALHLTEKKRRNEFVVFGGNLSTRSSKALGFVTLTFPDVFI